MVIRTLIVGSFALFASVAWAEIAPEPPSAIIGNASTASGNAVVVTAHPAASQAAQAILAQGGSATDAAIAAQMVLMLVEPQSSGIGGGGFMLHFDATSKKLTSFDGRETAPAGATPEMFLQENGQPIPFIDAVRSAKSVGVPGLVAMLHLAHQKHGSLPWPDIIEPAIALAAKGFPISPRLHESIAYAASHDMSQAWQDMYLDNAGKPKATGTLLKNPALAASLRAIATKGPAAFYKQRIAQEMVAYLRPRGSVLSMDDLAHYQPRERAPLCAAYRGYNVCSMRLPSSGGIALLQTLGILQHKNLGKGPTTKATHLILEAEKIAFADRARYVADGMALPISRLLDVGYLQKRASKIRAKRASTAPAKPGDFSIALANGLHADLPSTTHMSIVDGAGNAISMTSSVEHSFGAGLMVGGFILNNQLTDFSFVPSAGGLKVANAVAPNKRPRSSMTPTMIFAPDGSLYAVLGSPGGSNIIGYVTKMVIAMLDWRMPIQVAIRTGHFMHNNQTAILENGMDTLADELRAMGHRVTLQPQTSGMNVIIATPDGRYMGAADPRREGVAFSR